MSRAPIPHARRGKGLEALLNFAHSLYLNRTEDARIEHNGTRGVHRSIRGQTLFIPDPSKSAPDYYGCIAGRMVAFDAKATRNVKKWKLKSASRHQYEKLLGWARAGAACWLAIEHEPYEVLYLLRVSPAKPVADGRPELSFPPLPGSWVIEVPQMEGFYDWLWQVKTSWLDPEDRANQ